MFSYEKKVKKLEDLSLIDTTAIYIRKNGNGDTANLPLVYYRFWGDGRVQQVYPGKRDLAQIVNNPEIGAIGYYHIKKGRLKVQLIETLNGGQTGKRFGLFSNGNIWFYQQRPETYYGSWTLLKWLEKKNKTEWVKTKIDNLIYVKPTW